MGPDDFYPAVSGCLYEKFDGIKNGTEAWSKLKIFYEYNNAFPVIFHFMSFFIFFFGKVMIRFTSFFCRLF